MGAVPGISPKVPVGGAVRAFCAHILDEARAALETPELSDAVVVHDFRKALKRWRAFMRLLEPAVGPEAMRLRWLARDLARELAAARDTQAALDALADLAKAETGLSERSLTTLRTRLENLRESAEAKTLTDAMRRRMRSMIDDAEAAVANLPLDEFRFSDVSDGLREGYRRARNAIPQEWLQADSEELHELRQRVVVHRYQMDLIAPLWPRLGKVWVGEAQRLRERLGTCQDLAMLERLTAPHQPLARWRSRLLPPIAARQAAHVTVASRITGRLFAERPRAFRERLQSLWQGGKKSAQP